MLQFLNLLIINDMYKIYYSTQGVHPYRCLIENPETVGLRRIVPDKDMFEILFFFLIKSQLFPNSVFCEM